MTADLRAGRFRYGSGCLIGGRWVLTAAHVVVGAVSVTILDSAKNAFAATVNPRFVGEVDGPGPDLALLQVSDPGFTGDLPPLPVAAVDRDSTTGEPIERVHAIGYPWFAETPSPMAVRRETVDAIGVLPVGSGLAGGLLSLVVSIAPRPLPPADRSLTDSEWAGMSGAPVLAAGHLLGVVTEHAPRAGPSTITAVPLTALQQDQVHPEWGPGAPDPTAWLSRLGVGDPTGWPRLPAPPPPRPEPAYRATLREFGRTLHRRMPQLLGRQRELAEIAAYATGAHGYRWLVGSAYAGKSALLYEAVTLGLPDEVDVVCYFLSRRASDASSERFLSAVVPQLAYLSDLEPPVASRDEFFTLWEKAVERAERNGRHLLLAVDGLDEDLLPPGSPSVASLLPTLAGKHAHVLVSSRPRPQLPRDVPAGHPLQQVEPLDLPPFEGAEDLAELARREFHDLTHGAEADLAVDVLGLLTAAAGALTVPDLHTLLTDAPGATTVTSRQVKAFVDERAVRVLEPVGPAGVARWQFAHSSLLEYVQDSEGDFAQDTEELRDPQYPQRIHRWAQRWRDVNWTAPPEAGGIPRYLLDEYPATLASDPDRLTELASDPAWVAAAIPVTGVDQVLATLRTATTARPGHTVAAMLAVLTGQRLNLRSPRPVDQPGYVLRQLCLQAMEHGEDRLADTMRVQLRAFPNPGPIPLCTTHRASPALALELGEHAVSAVAVLGDGRVITGGSDGRVLMWDPTAPAAGPVRLGGHTNEVRAVAVLGDGRVITGGSDGRVLMWDPTAPAAGPVWLGEHTDGVSAVAVLGDGRVVTGGSDGRVLVWAPDSPAAGAVPLGEHGGGLSAVAVLGDGRVIAGGSDGRVLMWDPTAPAAGPVWLGEHTAAVRAVAVLDDGRVVTGGFDGRVLVWDPDRRSAAPIWLGERAGAVSPVLAVAVLDDGRVVTGRVDGRLLVWDPDRPDAEPLELGKHTAAVEAVAVLGDGRVVTGGYDARLLVWDPSHPIGRGENAGGVSAVAVLGDGRVVTGDIYGRMLLWDPTAPAAGPVWLGDTVGVQAVAVLGDGRVVTGGNDMRVLVWDPTRPGAGAVMLGKRLYEVDAMAVLGDGRVVTGGGRFDGRVLVWDPDRPGARPVRLGKRTGEVSAVAVLGDGRVVTGGSHGALVWNPSHPGAAPIELGENAGGVGAVAVLGDGRVVTGDIDGRVLVWDPTRPGAAPMELGKHRGEVGAVAVLGDGRVVTGGADRRVLVWDPTEERQTTEIGCTVSALAASPRLEPNETLLAIAHVDTGWSLWSA
ncbi:trypsin-like peptidase domain-containing protein [Modestobacter marinus]|uniref:trypsin-like peptidase domain-containing protein n=1 Tax=Modestobacter marinus TaxID=477641 RepID=UPI0034D476A9